ncbi:MAG TPA: hypothetical protein VFT27_11075 [Actinomycetota bacterium]|nr:hypothetical protein [Actinomycetota bacterium]
MRDGRARVPVMAVVLAVLTGCAGGAIVEPPASRPSATPSPTTDAAATPFPYSDEPVGVEPGTYRISRSEWSVANFTVTFPQGWTVQYGHVYAKPYSDAVDEFGFYAVVVDAIYTDACEGAGELMEVGPSVDDLAAALLEQPGPRASTPVETTLGGYPATRIDLTVRKGLDLKTCRLASFGALGLQVWYSPPADKYFVLEPDADASAYIVDVEGQRQVFLTQYRSGSSDEDVRELHAVLDSIHIET